jgi:S-adenosylmethionine decarboxylase
MKALAVQEALAVHVFLDLYGCPFELLDDPILLQESLRKAARLAKTTILSESFKKFEPQGVTGILLVSESHLSVHTWPECGYAALDIFSCGDREGVEKAATFLAQALRPERQVLHRVDRGHLNLEERHCLAAASDR